jgi:hypothetical protein
MANQNDVNEEEVIDVPEIKEEKDENGADVTDWKAKALEAQGIAKRYQTKLSKMKEAKPAPAVEKQEAKQETLDRIDRAVLRVEKITEPDEIALVESTMKESGKSLEAVLAMKYFQSELKEMREFRASKEAIPSSTRRSSQSSRDTVDYWIAKGELPPADQVKLRRDVVNARMATAKQKSKFTDNPVV